MIAAVILAGGVGSRVGAAVPKQFVEVLGRPVLSYTIERFDRHPEVDAIEVVCREGYRAELDAIVRAGGFAKVRWHAPGGETFQDSVISGLSRLAGELRDDDIVLVHYGASPMVSDAVISDAIRVCREKGNASPARSQVYLAAERTTPEMSTRFVDRDAVMCLNSPQALGYGYARGVYERARERGLLETVEPHTTSLMLALGDPVYFSRDESSNIKITTPDDLRLFEGWLLAQRARGTRGGEAGARSVAVHSSCHSERSEESPAPRAASARGGGDPSTPALRASAQDDIGA